MAERKSFVLYHSYAAALEMLSMEERGQLITAIFAHETDMKEPQSMSDSVRMAFAFISDTLTRDSEAYEEKCRKNAENGKKGGRPRGIFSKKSSAAEDKADEPCERAEISDDSENESTSELAIGPDECSELVRRGVPIGYFGERSARALEYAEKNSENVVDVLVKWWNLDRANKKVGTNFHHSGKYFDDWFMKKCALAFG